MGFHLHIENFRCLREVDLELGGVCALIGPNGSGKSTLLGALRFMSDTLAHGPTKAVENAGGGGMLAHLGSRGSILLRASIDELAWEIVPRPLATGVQLPMEQRFRDGDKTVIEQLPNSATYSVEGRTVAIDAGGLEEPDLYERLYGPDLDPSGMYGPQAPTGLRGTFVHGGSALGYLMNELRLLRRFGPLVFPLLRYGSSSEHALRRIRTAGSQLGNDTHLDEDGSNIFTVLRNWKAGDRSHEERFSFVLEGLRRSFPGLFEDLDFESAGQTVTGRHYMAGRTKPIPFYLAPTGLLVGLLHLACVASIEPGGIVAIDEFENSLHPHAIRVLIEHIRERAARLNLTVLLASHSPVVVNQFRDCPNKVIVMDPSRPPTPLDQLEDPEWLAQFSLGELLANENIASVKAAT